MIIIKTIVKGKNIKLKYDHKYFDDFYMWMMYDHEFKLESLKYRLSRLEWTEIISYKEIVSYDTYFESDKIEYRLSVGEKFGDDVVQFIEGTPEGDIIYYTGKEVSIDENKEEKYKLERELEKDINKIEAKLELLRNKKKWYQF